MFGLRPLEREIADVSDDLSDPTDISALPR